MGSSSFLGFSYPNLLLVFLKILSKKLRFCTRFCSQKDRPKGGAGDSFLFIHFIFLPVVLVLFLYTSSIFCLCPSFRVWSDRLYFFFGVFLP